MSFQCPAQLTAAVCHDLRLARAHCLNPEGIFSSKAVFTSAAHARGWFCTGGMLDPCISRLLYSPHCLPALLLGSPCCSGTCLQRSHPVPPSLPSRNCLPDVKQLIPPNKHANLRAVKARGQHEVTVHTNRWCFVLDN